MARLTDGANSITYDYDEEGLRTAKTVNGTKSKYVYTDDKLTFMQSDNNTMYFSYDSTGRPLSFWLNGTWYAYQCNQQGDVVGIIDENRQKVATYSYDAYGNQLSTEPTSAAGNLNPLRYRGYVYDEETKWYYLQSRYYNSEVGRFFECG